MLRAAARSELRRALRRRSIAEVPARDPAIIGFASPLRSEAASGGGKAWIPSQPRRRACGSPDAATKRKSVTCAALRRAHFEGLARSHASDASAHNCPDPARGRSPARIRTPHAAPGCSALRRGNARSARRLRCSLPSAADVERWHASSARRARSQQFEREFEVGRAMTLDDADRGRAVARASRRLTRHASDIIYRRASASSAEIDFVDALK